MHNQFPPLLSYVSLRQTIVAIPAIILAINFGGCAMFPSLNRLNSMKPTTEYQTAISFSVPDSSWPSERWWEAYGDVQLNSLVDEALRYSPDMDAAAARIRRAAAFSKVSYSALMPQLKGNVAVTEEKISYHYLVPRSEDTDSWNDYGLATLNLNWELDFWGKNRAGLEASISQLEASRAEFAQVRLTLTSAIGTNYAELAHLFAIRDMIVHSAEIRSKTVNLFLERFNNGLETKGSLSEAKARLAGVQGDLLMLDEQIGLQRNRLAALIGVGPDRTFSIKRPSVNLKNNNGLPAELATNLLGRRPDVVAARLLAEAQLRRVDQKKAEFYPNVNLIAYIGVQSLGLNMLTKSGSDIGGVGPAITLPIFTVGRLQGELRGTTETYNEAVANYNRTVTHALEDVASAAFSQKALASQLKKGEEAVEAAFEAYCVAKNRYEGGLANYLEVLYAEDILLNSQRILTNLQSRAFMLDVTLKRALGGGYQYTKK